MGGELDRRQYAAAQNRTCISAFQKMGHFPEEMEVGSGLHQLRGMCVRMSCREYHDGEWPAGMGRQLPFMFGMLPCLPDTFGELRADYGKETPIHAFGASAFQARQIERMTNPEPATHYGENKRNNGSVDIVKRPIIRLS